MNHRWDDNTCINCGVKRERRVQKWLIAIIEHAPYNYYKYKTKWYYINYGFHRPQCKIMELIKI